MSDDENLPQEVEDWLSQPHTRMTLERVQKEHKQFVLFGLLQAAKKSTDPSVTLWYARYEALENIEAFLATGEFRP